jgi:hypothetical protein
MVFSILLSSDTLSVLFLMARVEASHRYGKTGKATDTSFILLVLLSVRETEAVPSLLIKKILLAIPNELCYQDPPSRYLIFDSQRYVASCLTVSLIQFKVSLRSEKTPVLTLSLINSQESS